MKKLIAGALMAAGFLAGYTRTEAAAAEPVTVDRGRTAVIYFSWSPDGNTRFAAETIAAKLGAKLFEIRAQKPYSSHYRTCCDEAKGECLGKRERPILPVEGLELAQYDVILVGTPNWWGTMAPPVRTWIRQNAPELKGKTLCLFQTNGGGGMQNVERDFAELLPEAKLLPAQAFYGSSIRSNAAEVEKFVADRIRVREVPEQKR